MAQAPDADALALRGCVRQALRIFLPSDDVEVDGRPGALESVHGDRTGTVRFRDGAGAAQCLEALPLSARRVGQRVEVRGLEEGAGGAALNGKRATVQALGATPADPLDVRVDGEHDAQALHARHLFAPPDAGPARVLLRDCELRVPRGAYSRRRRSARDVAVLEWRGLCQLAANGAACADGARLRAPRKEGVHWYLPVACSAPLPAGSRATAVDLHVEGMDQGWGNSGDSGVLLYVVRAGEDAAPWEAEEPLLKVTFDHHRHPRPDHHVRLDGLLGLLGPQPGDRFQAFLQCPTYPGWSSHVKAVRVSVHCVVDHEEPLPGALPDDWEQHGPRAFAHLWAQLSNDDLLTLDWSHMSLEGQALQRVWPQPPAGADRGPVAPRLAAVPHPLSAGAKALLDKLDGNAPAAGAPPDAEQRRARYRGLRLLVHRTLDALEGDARAFAGTVCAHYAAAAPECVYRWEREIATMHDLVTGGCAGDDSRDAEDLLLRSLCDLRRRLAEAELHRAKGRHANSDMHFESFFYGSIHFGLPEQRDALRDPNRLNYHQLRMLRPGDVREALLAAYTPAAIRSHVRAEILEASSEGSQMVREKLVDWLRAHVPRGFQGGDAGAAPHEAWLYEACHDADYALRDVALNFMLCGMGVLRADGIACPDAEPAALVVPGSQGRGADPDAAPSHQEPARPPDAAVQQLYNWGFIVAVLVAVYAVLEAYW